MSTKHRPGLVLSSFNIVVIMERYSPVICLFCFTDLKHLLTISCILFIIRCHEERVMLFIVFVIFKHKHVGKYLVEIQQGMVKSQLSICQLIPSYLIYPYNDINVCPTKVRSDMPGPHSPVLNIL